MIILRFKAQLGNQMFQYAAVRTMAEQQGERLFTANRYNQLYNAFGLGQSKLIECAKDFLATKLPLRRYAPATIEETPGIFTEEPVERLPANAIVDGWFQSERYFAHNRARVCEWLRPRPHFVARAEEIMRGLGRPPEEVCVIHLRFGDYYLSDLGHGHPVLGWVLPVEYYQAALARLPAGLAHVVISDMPARARQWLDFLPNLTVIENEAAPTDLWLLTLARHAILSASTFSWWGAWLNPRADKQIYAPEFFNGWWAKAWVPRDIRVPDWHYIPADEITRRVRDWRELPARP